MGIAKEKEASNSKCKRMDCKGGFQSKHESMLTPFDQLCEIINN